MQSNAGREIPIILSQPATRSIHKFHVGMRADDHGFMAGAAWCLSLFVSFPMAQFGLIGKSLSHSFSKSYFEEKWKSENNLGHEYHLLEWQDEYALQSFLSSNKDYSGLNVTLPYKQFVYGQLRELTGAARAIKAVNCLRYTGQGWIGHNTDAEAFRQSLLHFIPPSFNAKALILGTGGASRAVQYALQGLDIGFALASHSGKGISYKQLHHQWDPAWKLIVNTTPLGMYPNVSSCPEIPFEKLDDSFYLMDLVYNPEKTLFLTLGANRACQTKNGLEMLHLQADLSWSFWNQ